MKVVLDTNVLISAFIFDGPVKRVWKKGKNFEYDLYLSNFIIDEFSSVIDKKFTSVDTKIQSRHIQRIKEVANIVEVNDSPDIVESDPLDNFIIATAQQANVDYIVTGDEDLLSIQEVGEIKIITPKRLLRKLSG
ncbi:MAG: putative toxin-antitoxin system toxin component, PIN family [Candidatus Paceibacteria bacterium]